MINNLHWDFSTLSIKLILKIFIKIIIVEIGKNKKKLKYVNFIKLNLLNTF